MKAALYIGLVAVVVGVCGCSSVESVNKAGFDMAAQEKVAVVSVEGNLRGVGAKNQIAGFFEMELLRKGYAPIERTQIEMLLKEQDFQISELTQAEGAANAGQMLNVPMVLMVSVPEFGDEKVSITAKIIDVEDASILWMGNGSGNTNKTLATILGAVLGALIGAGTTGDDDQVLGGVGGGVIGGVAGYMLAPQEAKMAQDIIKKMCKKMPGRM